MRYSTWMIVGVTMAFGAAAQAAPPPPPPTPPAAGADGRQTFEAPLKIEPEARGTAEAAQRKVDADARGQDDGKVDAGTRIPGNLDPSKPNLDQHGRIENERERFRFHEGRWWYWTPESRWVYWNGRQWQDYTAPHTTYYRGNMAEGYAQPVDAVPVGPACSVCGTGGCTSCGDCQSGCARHHRRHRGC